MNPWTRRFGGAVVLTAAGLFIPVSVVAQRPVFEVELEGGPVWQSGNDVEVPNDGTATRFALEDVVGAGPWAAGRLYVTWHVAARHALRLLAAPLSVTGRGVLDGPVDFAGASYSAAPVDATYTFNSYRLSYQWRFHSGARSELRVGFTAKVRDAAIVLAQGATTSRTDDLGFVPLLHLSGIRRLGDGWSVVFDADALAGGPGRAIDATVKLGYDFDTAWSVRAGYRTVEGGADVDSVYNFAWLNFASASIVWRP